jgi:hypothetical protein
MNNLKAIMTLLYPPIATGTCLMQKGDSVAMRQIEHVKQVLRVEKICSWASSVAQVVEPCLANMRP